MTILKLKKLENLLQISKNFIMIDNVNIDIKKKLAKANKKFNKNVWFYNDHFLDQPMMPGTLQVEAMLQTTVSLIYSLNKSSDTKVLIISETSKFLDKIDLSGKLIIESKLIKMNRGIIDARAFIKFKNKKVSESEFRFIDPEKFKI